MRYTTSKKVRINNWIMFFLFICGVFGLWSVIEGLLSAGENKVYLDGIQFLPAIPGLIILYFETHKIKNFYIEFNEEFLTINEKEKLVFDLLDKEINIFKKYEKLRITRGSDELNINLKKYKLGWDEHQGLNNLCNKKK